MNEWNKAQSGYLYDANHDEWIVKKREKIGDLCHEFNLLKPSQTKKREELLSKILPHVKNSCMITSPFYVALWNKCTHWKRLLFES